MRIDPQCERLKNAHHNFMKAFKTRIPFLWVFQKFASWRPWKAQLRCMSASTMRITVLWRPLKLCICLFMCLAKIRMMVYEDHKAASPWCARFNNVQHGFMKALKNVHLPFMSLSKFCITIYEGHKKMHLLLCGRISKAHHGFMKAVKMRISVLGVFQKRASRFMKATCVCVCVSTAAA